MKQFSLLIFCLLMSVALFSQQAIEQKIIFKHRFNGLDFQLDSSYTTSSGEVIRFDKCLFYVSTLKGITLKGDTIDLSKEHFLISANDSNSKYISFSAPVLKSIYFRVGVDSSKNISGIQTGVLDPSKGMFWTWNTGYIMAKLEGISPQANTAQNRFTHDVGGYKLPYNSVRYVQLNMPEKQNNNITILVDIAKWFDGKTIIKLAETPICHSPGKLAMQLANNFAAAFSIDNNKN